MQYQQKILNAEFIEDQQKICCQNYQGQLPSGQPLIEQPVVQNGQEAQKLQQVPIIPNREDIIVESPVNVLNTKEDDLRELCRCFSGCNCCFGLFSLLFMGLRCILTFLYDGIIIGAGVLCIVSDISFVAAVICGQQAISKYKEKLLLYYQILVFIAMIFEIAGSGIAFAYYKQQYNEDNEKNHRRSNEKKTTNEKQTNLVIFIACLIILILAYGFCIRLGRRIRFLMLDIFQARQQIANQYNLQRS